MWDNDFKTGTSSAASMRSGREDAMQFGDL